LAEPAPAPYQLGGAEATTQEGSGGYS
jgi:hypothetical protein